MINFEWGKHGIKKYSASSDITVIVDILSFSTCVDIAISNGALLYPYRYKDDSAVEYAESLNAELASFKRIAEIFSLSPASLKNIPSGTKIVLPSPNGSELSLLSESRITICACLRNFKAVGEFINTIGGNVTVIAAGEKWQDGSIRFAVEDFIGAGAVLSVLNGSCSPEAKACRGFFESARIELTNLIRNCVSGNELIERGFACDVGAALELNISDAIPILVNGCYVNQSNASLH